MELKEKCQFKDMCTSEYNCEECQCFECPVNCDFDNDECPRDNIDL